MRLRPCTWRRGFIRHSWQPFVVDEAEATVTDADGDVRELTVAVFGTQCPHCGKSQIDVVQQV